MTLLRLFARDFRANGLYLATSLGILFVMSTGLAYGVLGEPPQGYDDRWVLADSIEMLLYLSMIIVSTKLASILFFKIDEMNDVQGTFASLPVARNEIVKARYMSSLVQVLVVLGVHLLAILPAALIRGGLDHIGLKLIYHPAVWIISFVLVLLSNSFSFPVYFRFGLTRGLAVFTVIQVLMLVTTIALLVNFVDNDSFFRAVEQLIKWVAAQNAFLLISAIIGGTLLIMAGSATLSIKLYNTKDL